MAGFLRYKTPTLESLCSRYLYYVGSLIKSTRCLTLIQSGAIIDYLVENYDKENKLRYTQSPEKYLQVSWRDFQMSGQGPYFGQRAWFATVSSPHNDSKTIIFS